MKINWRWPATARNGLVPWYIIAWNLPWAVLIYTGLGITFLGILLANGRATAKRWWRNAA